MRLYFYILATLLLSGCVGYQHIATPQYVPLNSRKGDLTANVSLRYAQVGYTVTNNISVFATGYMRDTDASPIDLDTFGSKEGSGNNDHDDSSYEINAGTSFFKDTPKFNYEIHVGAGGGKAYYLHDKDFHSGSYHFEMTARRASVFVQPSSSYKIPKIGQFLQFGVFTKVALYKYYDLDIEQFATTTLDRKDRSFMNRNYLDLYFLEPGACIRGGSKWVKGNAMISVPINLQGNTIRIREFNLYLSVFLKFNLLRDRS
jgi:hypothetical protein